MSNYIDGFVLPIHKNHIEAYKKVVTEVAAIWKEHGALSYSEYICEDEHLKGTRSFASTIGANHDEIAILGWITFRSKEARDMANKLVANDSRMHKLIVPLIEPSRIIFDASRMAYGGFQELYVSPTND